MELQIGEGFDRDRAEGRHRREYIQRLGRVLRPKETRATLYELVTEGTTEERVADRRRERV